MKEGEHIEIQVGEHIFITPPIPPKRDILFHEKKKEDQYWQRLTDFPVFFEKWNNDVEIDTQFTVWEGKRLVSLSKSDTDILIATREREIRRMKEGIWFYNNGEPTHLTGGHYFALQHGAMKGSKNDVELRSIYGQYMRLQRNYCYFIEICKTTKCARGGNAVKPKKTGITQLQALLILCDAMLERTSLFRIMSTKEDVAKDTNFAYIAYAMEKMPPILTPSYRKNLGAIYFGNPDPSRQTSKKKKTDIEYLDSWIQTVATIVNAFDSQTNKVAWVDEQSKIEMSGGSVKMLHDITLSTVMQGFIRHGYIIYTGYVSEKNNKSFREAKIIYYEGKLKTIDAATGMTKSKLLSYAMTVLDGVFGACDKYGNPDLKLIWNEINAEHEKLKNDPLALMAYKRQNPTCEEDMWQEMAGNGSIFDNFRLSIKQRQIMEDESVAILPFDFNLKWTIEPKIDDVKHVYKFDGEARIVPVTDQEKMAGKAAGIFKWYRKDLTPDFFLEKHLNRIGRDKKGKLCPLPDNPFYMAIDPVNYADATDVVVASKNAIQVFILPNPELNGYFNKKVTHKRLMVSYLHRSLSPRETLMHTVQAIMLFGCYVLIESNAPWLRTKLKEWGFANFLIEMNKETGILEPYREYADQKKVTSTDDIIGEYTTTGRIHLSPPDESLDMSGIDNIEYLDDPDVITQLMNFNPDKTTEFDAAVCYLLGIWGIEVFLGWRQKQIDKTKRTGDRSMHQAFVGLVH